VVVVEGHEIVAQRSDEHDQIHTVVELVCHIRDLNSHFDQMLVDKPKQELQHQREHQEVLVRWYDQMDKEKGQLLHTFLTVSSLASEPGSKRSSKTSLSSPSVKRSKDGLTTRKKKKRIHEPRFHHQKY